ncbi:MAG: hypothetical protein IJU77_01965 [Butyrivibrio sp.]|nr:hypothetical protein [Butyrivibrio sp.]
MKGKMIMIIQNLRFPQEGICSEKELYFHEGRDEKGAPTLDLDGYFNLFYIEKHVYFTDTKTLKLTFTVKGFKRAYLMHDRVSIESKEISDGTFSFDCPYNEVRTGVYWLRLVKDENVQDFEFEFSGFFEGSIKGLSEDTDNTTSEAEALSDGIRTSAEIGVAICTFKREFYVLRNLSSMLDFFEKNPDLARHYHIFLVDNGKTLAARDDFKALKARAEELEKRIQDTSGKKNAASKGEDNDSVCFLRLIENANTGGTGGFRRGMEEAIKEKENLGLTNLLLFDDDAVFDPELFLRLYALIVSLKDKYRDITIGGAMWREDMPYLQHAMGESYEHFQLTNPLLMLDISRFENCTKKEMCTADAHSGLFSGWWCCCYSMDIITKKNLPLNMFIHMDDILFCKQHADRGILFLPGIGVWHQGFELRFPGINSYYNARNELITEAVMESNKPSHVARWATKQLSGRVLSFQYAEMELAYRGITDFLKGPDWLDNVDSEKLNQELRTYYGNEVVFKPLKEILPPDQYEKLEKLRLTDEAKKAAIINHWYNRAGQKSILKYLTLNGWLLPPYKKMGLFSNADSPWVLYRRKTALLYEPTFERGYFEKKRPLMMLKFFWMSANVAIKLIKDYERVANAYKKRAGV